MTEKNTDVQTIVHDFINGSPFIKSCNLEVIEHDAESGKIVLRMPFDTAFARDTEHKQFHGGALAALIDTAGDLAVAIVVGGPVPTINLRVDYMRPAIGDYVEAHAIARRVGRTISIVDIDVFGESGKLVSVGRGIYSSIRG